MQVARAGRMGRMGTLGGGLLAALQDGSLPVLEGIAEQSVMDALK